MKTFPERLGQPDLIDETGTILAGHGRREAARRLGMREVPTITIVGLTDEEKRAIVIADNRMPEQAVWTLRFCQSHFESLIEVDFDVELTGFTTGEVDLMLDRQPAAADPADNLDCDAYDGPPVSREGALSGYWSHRLLCGTALSDSLLSAPER